MTNGLVLRPRVRRGSGIGESVSRRVPNEIKSSRNSGVLPSCKLWHIIKFIITIG